MRNQAESTRRSGAIFGILKQMKETFETNLSSSQKEEMQSQSAYEDLKAAKESRRCFATVLIGLLTFIQHSSRRSGSDKPRLHLP